MAVDIGLDGINDQLGRLLPWQLVLLTFATTVLVAWVLDRLSGLIQLIQDKG